ncbi:MAG: cytidine deaminase [Bacteroidales bacterium]|nr:cytidine deaminase [Bacteroidales bacterium]MDY0215498.1 cytidine deaminase [Bacteroidales bacterium]
MTNKKQIHIEYSEFSSIEELSPEDKNLLNIARKNLSNAYAPYSEFKVSAALRLENEEIILGTNQENAAYPSGLCAERVAVFYASANFPKVAFTALAITSQNIADTLKNPVFPCGSCRQVILEYEILQKKPIRFILSGTEGSVVIIDGVKNLLPFSFDGTSLK